MEKHDKSSVPCDNSDDFLQISWPAGGLPTEIFTDILLVTLSDLHFGPLETPALELLYQLRLVSLAWRCIVDNTPALWTFIESSVPLNIIDIALERSEASLLSIWFGPNALMTAPLFMEKVVPHIGRWVVAELCETAWEYLPQAPAPLLRDLSLTVHYQTSRSLAPRVFRGEFTSLQGLLLRHVYLIGPLPDFGRNLRFLSICQLARWDAGITCAEIHQLLLLHPSLVEVELEGFRWSVAVPNPEMLEDISLHSLRRFSLLGIGSSSLACMLLLQKITAPNCTSFELSIADLPEGYSSLLRVEPYFASVITPVSSDLTLSLSFGLDFSLAIGRGDKTFELSGWIPEPDAELDWVVDLLVRYRPNVTDLEIATFGALSDGGLSNLFMSLPDVTQLRSEGKLEAVWNVLGKPAVPGVDGGPAQWLLPALEKLNVLDRSDEEGQCFIGMIQAREAAAMDTDSTRSLAGHHPVRLKRVEYRSVTSLEPDGRLPELLGDRFVFESMLGSGI